MPDDLSPVQQEREFVESLVEKFTQQDIAAEKGDAPKDPAAAPVPVAAAPIPADPTPAPEAPVVPAEKPNDTPPADAPEPPAKEPGNDDELEEEIVPEDELDEDFKAEAAKHKVALTVDDLPVEARPLVQKRIKELEAMATRATMDARAYRKEEAQFRAEQKFQEENRAEYVADLLLKNPELGDAVNAIIEGLTTPHAKQALEVVVERKRERALADTNAALKAQSDRAERGIALENYTRTQAMKHGVPFENVNDAIVADILGRKAGDDITERDIDAIVAEKARRHEASLRAARREASKKYVQDKVKTRETGGLKVKPGTGNIPAPSGAAKPKNDAEFAESFAAKMG